MSIVACCPFEFVIEPLARTKLLLAASMFFIRMGFSGLSSPVLRWIK